MGERRRGALIAPAAVGYIRFSKDTQELGDSVRRQSELILAWLKRHPEVSLDTSLGEKGFFVDRGKTGFAVTGESRVNLGDDYALGEFITACEAGRVPVGSYLIVESADRLSRESPVVAINLFTRLLMLGVVVVTLVPEQEYKTDADIGRLISIGVTIDRAHDESRVKNVRGRNVWSAKRANARSQVLTSLIPEWCRLVGAKKVGNRLVGGELKPDAAKVEILRRLFEMCLAGKGVATIARELNAEKVPVVGRSSKWSDSGVYNLLTSTAVVGEYHPHTGNFGSRKNGKPDTRKPTGEVVDGYYPAIIDRELWSLAQNALRDRGLATQKGRRGKHVNLFGGLLYDARDGGKISYRHNAVRSLLHPVNAKKGVGGIWASFPCEAFETLILSKLVELKAADILPESNHGGTVARLAALHAEKVSELAEFQREIDGDPRLLKTLKATLLRLEAEAEQVAADLAHARREAASPLSAAWGEFHGIAEMLAKDGSDELRQRCKLAIRRLVESVHCLFAGPSMTRIAAVRIQFHGTEAHRDYLLVYLCKNRQRLNPPEPTARSFRESGLGNFDLRKPGEAAKLDKLLSLGTVVPNSGNLDE